MSEFILCFENDKEKNENIKQKPKIAINENLKNPMIKEEENLNQNKLISEYNNKINISKLQQSSKVFKERKDFGNIEYKLKLNEMTNEKLEKKITKMKFRLKEGNGECHYYIGVEDNGNPLGINEKEMNISIEIIRKIVSEIENAKIRKIEYLKGKKGLICEITIIINNILNNNNNIDTLKYNDLNYEEIKIGLIGEENNGKSTLIGCLISDKKDNGNGLTRNNVFKYRHEINCGNISSFTHQIMGFDKFGKKTNVNNYGNINSWSYIVNNSEKIINFIDMGENEISLKNSINNLSNNYLDYIILCISVDKGITNNTVLFLEMIFKLNIPVIIVFTKIDLINENDRENILFIFNKIIRRFQIGKNPLLVKNKNDILLFSSNMNEGIIPMFLLSNKSGEGLDFINNFLSILPKQEHNYFTNNKNNDMNDYLNLRFDFLQIHKEKEGKNNKKFIVEGIVTQGIIISNEYYNLGPFNEKKNNEYIKVKVQSINYKKNNVQYCIKDQFCSLEILLENENNLYEKIRNGMVLLGNQVPQIACKKMKVELLSLNDKEIKIKKSNQPIIHLEHISQVCKFIIEENKNEIIIPCGKSIIVDIEFVYYPEYVRKNSYLLILDNNLKLYGTVKEVYL